MGNVILLVARGRRGAVGALPQPVAEVLGRDDGLLVSRVARCSCWHRSSRSDSKVQETCKTRKWHVNSNSLFRSVHSLKKNV